MIGPIRAVRAMILTDATLVASLTADGIIKVRRGHAGETDRLPYVLLWIISDRPGHHLGGRAELRHATVQVDVYAESGGQASQIAADIATAIAAFGRGISDNVWVSSIMESDTRVNDQRDRAGAERPTAVIQTDYELVYR